jgi:hypothetical protein
MDRVGSADGVLFEGFRLDLRGGVLFRLDQGVWLRRSRSRTGDSCVKYPPTTPRSRVALPADPDHDEPAR